MTLNQFTLTWFDPDSQTFPPVWKKIQTKRNQGSKLLLFSPMVQTLLTQRSFSRLPLKAERKEWVRFSKKDQIQPRQIKRESRSTKNTGENREHQSSTRHKKSFGVKPDDGRNNTNLGSDLYWCENAPQQFLCFGSVSTFTVAGFMAF